MESIGRGVLDPRMRGDDNRDRSGAVPFAQFNGRVDAPRGLRQALSKARSKTPEGIPCSAQKTINS
jgi:hypothetical protein